MDANNKYYQQAQQQYNPTHNLKVDALKNQLAQNQQSLDQQKVGINNNYDLQVNNQNLNNKLNKLTRKIDEVYLPRCFTAPRALIHSATLGACSAFCHRIAA